MTVWLAQGSNHADLERQFPRRCRAGEMLAEADPDHLQGALGGHAVISP